MIKVLGKMYATAVYHYFIINSLEALDTRKDLLMYVVVIVVVIMVLVVTVRKMYSF